MLINKITYSDYSKFKEVYLAALTGDWPTLEGRDNIEEWNNNLDSWFHHNYTILTISNDNEIIGYICFDVSRILHLWIDKRFRGLGYSSLLINHLKMNYLNPSLGFSAKVYECNVPIFLKFGFNIKSNSGSSCIMTFK